MEEEEEEEVVVVEQKVRWSAEGGADEETLTGKGKGRVKEG